MKYLKAYFVGRYSHLKAFTIMYTPKLMFKVLFHRIVASVGLPELLMRICSRQQKTPAVIPLPDRWCIIVFWISLFTVCPGLNNNKEAILIHSTVLNKKLCMLYLSFICTVLICLYFSGKSVSMLPIVKSISREKNKHVIINMVLIAPHSGVFES